MRGGLIDLFPMGSAVPYRVDLFGDEIDSIRTFDPDTPAQPLPGARGAPAARPRVPDGRDARAPLSAPLARAARRRPDQGAHLQGHRQRHRHRRHRVLPAAVLRRDGDGLRLPRRATRRWCCTARSTPRCSASGPTRASATASCSTTRERPLLPPEALFLRAERVLHARRSRMRTLALRGATPTTPPRAVGDAAARPSASSAARPSRWQRLQGHIARDAAPRADRRRERRPAREPARAAARPAGSTPPSVDYAGRVRGQRRAASRIAAAPLAAASRWRRERARRSSSSPRPSCSPTAPARAGAARQEQVSDVEALIKDLSELKVGDPVVHVNHGIGRYSGLINLDLGRRRERVPAPRVRRQGDALRAGGAAAPDQPLHRRQRRRSAAAHARLAASGTRPSARPPSRCATPPPSCSNLYARRAAREGHAFRFSAARLRGLRRRASASRRRPTSTPRSTP